MKHRNADEWIAARIRRRRIVIQASGPEVFFSYAPGDTVAGETFTRTTAARYFDSAGVLQAVASGAKRDNHYISGERTLLLEPSRTNNFLASRALDDASWAKFNATISVDAVNGPEATLYADKIVESTANNYHGVYLGNTSVTGDNQSLSIAGKAAERSWLLLYMADNAGIRQSWVNLATGAVGTKDSGHTITTRLLANGWTRIELLHHTVGLSQLSPQFFLVTGDGASTFAGDGSSGLYLTDLQWEVGASYNTTPIPTTTATVTRNADSLSWPGVTTSGAATLYERYYDLSTGTRVATATAYTSGAAIIPSTGRAYTRVAVIDGTLSVAQCESALGI